MNDKVMGEIEARVGGNGKDVKRIFKCLICKSYFTLSGMGRPKMFHCQHNYCVTCVTSLVSRAERDHEPSISCRKCGDLQRIGVLVKFLSADEMFPDCLQIRELIERAPSCTDRVCGPYMLPDVRRKDVKVNQVIDGRCNYPSAVSICADGTVVIADKFNHRLQLFTSTGLYLKSIGRRGSGKVEFDSPEDVKVTLDDEKLLVADTENRRIQVLGKDGEFMREMSRGLRGFPHGVCSDQAGTVYVCDFLSVRRGSQIVIYDSSGRLLKMISSPHLQQPRHIAVHDEKLYIPDLKGKCVVVLKSSTGEHISSIGKKWLVRPVSVSVDVVGNVLVAEGRGNGQGKISIITCINQVHMFRERVVEIGEGKVGVPQAVTLTRDNKIIVCDIQKNNLLFV